MKTHLRRGFVGLAAAAVVTLTAACWPFDGAPTAAPTAGTSVAIPADSPAATPAESPSAAKPTPADLSGTWSGTWANQIPDDSTGSFTLTWTRIGSQLSGSITITGKPCLTGGAITGSTDGQSISFGAVNGEVTVAYDGTVAGSTMSAATRRTAATLAAPGPRRGCETAMRAYQVLRSIAVLPALHSAQELETAGLRILAQDGVTGVAALPDGSALLVSVDGDEEYGRALPAVRSADVPVVIEPYERPILAIGRQQDTSPYSGGAIYHFPLPDNYTGVCTTGFAVRVGVVDKILSAGHCGDDGDTVFEGSGSGPANVLGTIGGSDLSHDTMLINADATGAVYTGPHTSTTSKPVHMVINNYPHTLVCTSGAVTGQHCQIRIVAINQAIKVQVENGFYPIFGLVKAEHIQKAPAAGIGDSGGPVVAQDAIPADFLLVYPLGTITAVDGGGQVPCGPTQLPSLCSWRVYYADINAALARYSATIVT